MLHHWAVPRQTLVQKDELAYSVVRPERLASSYLGETVPLDILEERTHEQLVTRLTVASVQVLISPLQRLCMATSTTLRTGRQPPKVPFSGAHTGGMAGVSPEVCGPTPSCPFHTRTWLLFQKKGHMGQWSLIWLSPNGG